MLSMKAKYGLRAVTALARRFGEGPVLISDLASQETIPRKFLEIILLDLKRVGFLQSRKGKGGGYQLSRHPSTIYLGDLIRALDGPLALLPCVSQSAYRRCDGCIDEQTCAIRAVMKEVRDATADILDGTSLASMVERSEGLRDTARAVMYHI
jgi:Rrf2 family protein